MCSLGAVDPSLRAPQFEPGQAQALGRRRVPQSCELQDFLPNDGNGAQPGSPYSWLGSRSWVNGNYYGGSNQCYQNQPMEPMFPRQARWDGDGNPGGGWWPQPMNSGILLKPANFCGAPYYRYDALAPWGLKSR